ncbi:sporulation peptidase YabG [Carboxydocella sp. JDF658]|nr:sporulation peptidase YabG [Carboxydocella sp. JDF658]
MGVTAFKIGDIVARRSYQADVFFRIVRIRGNHALLRGIDVRLEADAPLDDLVLLSDEEVRRRRLEFIKHHHEHLRQILVRQAASGQEEQDFFELPGRVLHLDGDQEYLNLCLNSYQQLKINCWGFMVPEMEQPQRVTELLAKYQPDILVLTGHDGLLKKNSDWKNLDSYRNSRYFIEAVKAARSWQQDKDALVIFAGACQSYYEALLQAGANYASAPQRILIHAFDPVLVVERVAYSPFQMTVPVEEVIKATISGVAGIGGLETRGKLRKGKPKTKNFFQ